MNAEELIKELDPEYIRCDWCKRMMHKSKLDCSKVDYMGQTIDVGSFECIDYNTCNETIARKAVNAI